MLKRENPFQTLRSLKKKNLKNTLESGKDNQKCLETAVQETQETVQETVQVSMSGSALRNAILPIENENFILDQSMDSLFVKLNENEKIIFKGAVKAAHIYGKFSILGFEFDEKNLKNYLNVYSPTTESLLAINHHPFYTQDIKVDVKVEMNDEEMNQKIKEWIEKDPGCCIVLLKPLDDGILGIEKMMPVFRGCFTEKVADSTRIIPGLIWMHNDDASLNVLAAHETILKSLTKGIHCIVGPKNTGKSTIARYFINSLLSKYVLSMN